MKKFIKHVYILFIYLFSSGIFFGYAQPLLLQEIIDHPAILYTKNYGNSINQASKCTIQRLKNGNYKMKIVCLKNQIFGTEHFTNAVDSVREYIKDFDQEYNLEKNIFYYSGSAQPLFKNNNTQKKYTTLKKMRTLMEHQNRFSPLPIHLDQEIELTTNEVALADMGLYSFYPARKFIHELGPCSRINYRIATASIDKKLVPAHKKFNINKRIGYRRGYCKGDGSIQRPFYGGVCGASTQVFRISLLHPFLETHDRENHGIWYSRYYGEKITGDDSSIVDFRQQLTLENTSDDPVYFRYIEVEKNKNVLIVAISPKKYDKHIKITKQQTGPLSAYLTKTIYHNSIKEYFQDWTSKYRMIDNGFTE